jgi:hypothetical protein
LIDKRSLWNILGGNTTNFTATNDLFLAYPQINLWKFEVVDTFLSETSSSSLNFIINQPPSNGSCSIDPLNGTTSSLFNISCSDWFDADGIKDYSFYGMFTFIFQLKTSFVELVWTSDSSKRTIIAFSSISIFQVRLPSGDDQTSLLYIVASIRDQLDGITEFNMSSVSVIPDSVGINNLINDIQSSSNRITNNPIVQLLASGNQNTVGQVLTSLSQQFNQMNSESVNKAVSSRLDFIGNNLDHLFCCIDGIPATSISISPLGSQCSQGVILFIIIFIFSLLN